jgi:hypothetical protein
MQIERPYHNLLVSLLMGKMWDLDEKILFGIVDNLSSLQRIILRVGGSVFLENITLRGWRENLPVYLFKCSLHGLQLAYPSGHMRILHCPKCMHENLQEKE